MSSTRVAIEKYVHRFLQVERFLQDSCLNGLQVEGKGTVRTIATAVTASLFVIQRAVELGADALFVHHGLFLRGKEVLVTGIMKEKIATLVKNDLSLFAYHLPLDAHRFVGNNWAIARKLGMKNLQPFGAHQGEFIGVRGVLPQQARMVLSHKLEKLYNAPPQVALGGKEKIRTCGIISGNAHKWIHEAIDAKLDCFVTGTHDEPIWHIAHEEGINFLSFGHAATEKIGMQLLGKHLERKFGVKALFIEEPNPF